MRILYQLSHQGSPRILGWVAYPFSRGSSWPRNQPGSPALQADSLPAELLGKPIIIFFNCILFWDYLRILWCWSWNSNTLDTWCEELTHWKRPWCWERLRAGEEGDDIGWDGSMASLTQWTWVWVNSGSWWWTGSPGVLWFMVSQRVGHDWVTELKDPVFFNTCTHSCDSKGLFILKDV